ncbi:hypothetical protein APHAL10511_002824 [Amanita phalloides]|nr:hypothetical protein APHAL10511_002824 [Amanita phalloides]
MPSVDDDDNTICPVCDADCTCSALPQPSTSLKIKLTVPQRMLSSRRSSKKRREKPAPPPRSSPHTIKPKSIFIKQKPPSQKSRLAKDRHAAAVAAAVSAAKKHRHDRNQLVSDDDDDTAHFPTFVSASALSSLSSDSDSSSSDGFDTDSEIEAEEENFIIHQVRDKARVKRELLGDDNQKKRDQHNNWVIRPRKKSVSPSGGDMDVDSDVTEDDDQDDDDDDDDGDEDDEEPDGKSVGRGYVGLATGWSEDEESSFDADIFFANLSGSDSNGSSSTSGADDADPSDTESVSAVVTDLLPHLRQGIEALPFEVTESWDGQIVFTNGIRDGQGVLDIDFEIDAAHFMIDSSPSSGDADNSDVDMIHSDRGYEEDLDGGDGDTTDEELVGENDLPNERAMELFSFPFTVSAINPLSTVSPAVSPGPRSRIPFNTFSSPKPADILAGRVFWESDGLDDVEDTAKAGAGPRRGSFVANLETRNAVIDDSHKDVPSPHPSFRRNKARRLGLPNLRQQALITDITSSPVADRSSPFVSPEDSVHPRDMPYLPSIALNDVLEPSFLDPEPDQHQALETPCSPGAATSGAESDSKFNRWDRIPVSAGAFRQTRETGTAITDGTEGWRSSTPRPNTVTDYGKMIRASPFAAMREMLAGPSSSSSLPRRSKKKRMSRMMDISPVILPRDGDQTPTNAHVGSSLHHSAPQPKSRKELRRERKLKRKSHYPHQYNPHQYRNHHSPNGQHYQHHHAHRHYPNSKTRGAAAVQRASFASSSFVPPLSL